MLDSPEEEIKDNIMETKWPKIRDLPEIEREPFTKWLEGQTRPLIEDSIQDAYFPWDYEDWKKGFPVWD